MPRGRPFKKGESGNPAGKPKGVLGAQTKYPQLAEHAPEIIDKVIELAKAGDRDALQLLVPRLVPVLRAVDRPVQLPTTTDPITAAENVITATLAGEIPPDVAERVMATLRGAVAVRQGGAGGLPDEARGQALRELRELFLNATPDVDLPVPGAAVTSGNARGGDDDADE